MTFPKITTVQELVERLQSHAPKGRTITVQDAVWFIALWEADKYTELSHKEMAGLLLEGIKPITAESVPDFLLTLYEDDAFTEADLIDVWTPNLRAFFRQLT